MKSTLERTSDHLYGVFGVDSIGVAKWIAALTDEVESLKNERTALHRELREAVSDINRLGSHSASPEHCAICELVKTYGFDPEELRSVIEAKVGAGGAAE